MIGEVLLVGWRCGKTFLAACMGVARFLRGVGDQRQVVTFTEVSRQEVKFKRVCAWCKTVMDEGDPEAPVSHSICPECDKKLIEEEENQEEL